MATSLVVTRVRLYPYGKTTESSRASVNGRIMVLTSESSLG